MDIETLLSSQMNGSVSRIMASSSSMPFCSRRFSCADLAAARFDDRDDDQDDHDDDVG